MTHPTGTVAIDALGASSALVLLADGDGHRLGTVDLATAAEPVDLTRPSVVPDPSATVAPLADQARALDPDALTAWTALGLATTCADLVGTMQGAVTLADDLRRRPAPVRGAGRLVPGRPAPAGRRLRGHRGVPQRRPPRRLGGGRPAGRGGAGGRRGGQGLLRPGRPERCARPPSRCTAASATPGSAWPTSTCAGRCCPATSSVGSGPASPASSTHHGLGGDRGLR